MTQKELEVYNWLKGNPGKTDVAIQAMRSMKDLEVLDALADRGIVIKDDWPSYNAANWNDVEFDEQVHSVLSFITSKYKTSDQWETSLEEVVSFFNDELHKADVSAILKYMMNEGMVANLSSKDGLSIGCIDETHLRYKKYNGKSQSLSAPSIQYINKSTNNTLQNFATVHGSVQMTNSERSSSIEATSKKQPFSRAELIKVIGAVLGFIATAVGIYFRFFNDAG
jgi:hypothetical protein